jgi:hypothetical protein
VARDGCEALLAPIEVADSIKTVIPEKFKTAIVTSATLAVMNDSIIWKRTGIVCWRSQIKHFCWLHCLIMPGRHWLSYLPICLNPTPVILVRRCSMPFWKG